LDLREGIQALGEITSMASQLIRWTANTCSAFGQLSIVLVEENHLSVIIELFRRKLCVHEMSVTLNTFYSDGVLMAFVKGRKCHTCLVAAHD
jgi:hypothetical protein